MHRDLNLSAEELKAAVLQSRTLTYGCGGVAFQRGSYQRRGLYTIRSSNPRRLKLRRRQPEISSNHIR
ncbi:hypothetical protein VC83_06404 [Pseudogymnoascus destructans]|uniref:Uncharacterized protein n=1 Tax=Pseudogymnoascus destructans TaxID=655981 RepID=A0A177ABA1_9PEZI|nr:uncharacterized protein VC83_06404 [Pseudogymnoascus destructans]OAF58394.1 hypothetical protein VC83_06404 [Pseudogymnoascus destructans]